MSDRYARQLVLPQVGPAGQARIAASTVLVVGAGGLGCALLPYLSGAGVGRIVIVDPDRIETINLHRQPLYRSSDRGRLKARAARAVLSDHNPEIGIEAVCEPLTPANAASLVAGADVIVDAADRFAVTYVLSDECHRVGKPLVSASVIGLSGYVGAFCAGAPSYRAVFPELPLHAGACADVGVLGTAVGVLGTLQAHIVLALILGLEPPVLGRLFSVDLQHLRLGGFSFEGAPEPAHAIPFIAPTDLAASDLIVDLRSAAEAPVPASRTAMRASVDEIEHVTSGAPSSRRIVLCCRSGLRAWRAAAILQARGRENLALLAWGDP